jgi:hypothetical protein
MSLVIWLKATDKYYVTEQWLLLGKDREGRDDGKRIMLWQSL